MYVKQAAAKFGVPRTTVWWWIRERKIPYSTVNGFLVIPDDAPRPVNQKRGIKPGQKVDRSPIAPLEGAAWDSFCAKYPNAAQLVSLRHGEKISIDDIASRLQVTRPVAYTRVRHATRLWRDWNIQQ